MKIDEIDVAILRALQKDARTKYSDIANQCEVSVDTIIKRFRKLRRNGVVKRTTLLLDPRSFGQEVIANFAVDAEPSCIPEVISFLREQSGVVFATHSMGSYDVFAIAMKRTMNEMNTLKETIQSHTKVNEVQTSIWVDQFLLCPQNFELEPLLEARR
ncbi:Lrp/AsnC family transcriptional regulator [Candidatus Bathyarchaeota archaeon]|nr:Lrp/AsnC family transcriptional regulator [Candidatus Bathyarchaeota archaeon]